MMSVSTSHAFLCGEFLSSLLAQHTPLLHQVNRHTHTDQPNILPVLVEAQSSTVRQPSPVQSGSPAQAQQSELNKMISTIIWPEVTRITRLCCLRPPARLEVRSTTAYQTGWTWPGISNLYLNVIPNRYKQPLHHITIITFFTKNHFRNSLNQQNLESLVE